MTAAGGASGSLDNPPRPRSPTAAPPTSGERRWGGTTDGTVAANAAARLACASLGPGLQAVGAHDARLLLGLDSDQQGARRLGDRIDELVARVLQREGKDRAPAAKVLANAGSDNFRLHAATSRGSEGMCAMESFMMCQEQGSPVGWTQGEHSTLISKEERHRFFKRARELVRKKSYTPFFTSWARAHVGAERRVSPANVPDADAEAALEPLRRCLAATCKDEEEPAEGLNDLGFAILAYLFSVDIVRVELGYDMTGSSAKTTQRVSLFPHRPPPAREPNVRQSSRLGRTNLRLPIFMLGVSTRITAQDGAIEEAHHVQPILLVPPPPTDTTTSTREMGPADLDVRSARLYPWAGHAALAVALSLAGPHNAPAMGAARFQDAKHKDAPQGPLPDLEGYLRPRHLSTNLLPPVATPAQEPQAETPRASPRRKGRGARRKASDSKRTAATAPTVGDIICDPEVALLLHAVASRPELRATIAGLTNGPLPPIEDRRSTARLVHAVLRLICPPEHDNLPTMPRPKPRQVNAIIFLCCVLFPLLLARGPRLRCPALAGGPAARAARFLRSAKDATDMLKALLGIDALPEPPPTRRRDLPPAGRPGDGWCSADKLQSLVSRFKKVKEQFHAGNGSKAYATATRAVTPPAPVVTPDDAHAHLVTLHPGCEDQGGSPLLAEPFEHGVQQAPAPGDDPVPDARPLGVRLDDSPAFPSAELDAVLTDAFLLSALRGMPRATTPGPFSPTTALLQELARLGQSEHDLADLPGRLCAFARQYTLGKLPRLAHELLSESTLLGIPKSDKGVRPIAMGDTWGKWGARCAVVAFRHRIRDMFPTFQLGVQIEGGIEAAVLLHRLSLELRPEDVTLLLDMKNAFNSVSREAVLRAVRKRAPHLLDLVTRTLAHRSRLWLHQSCRPDGGPDKASIWSTQGVRQGDAISPMIFSLVMEDALDDIRAALGEREAASALIMAYLDDVSIRAPYHVICRVLAVAKDVFAKYGLTLNPTKCVIFETPRAKATVDAHRQATGAAGPRYQLGPPGPDATELTRSDEDGYVVLGTPVGTDEYVLRKLREKVNDLRADAEALTLLGHDLLEPLMALSLVRSCFAHKIRHLARTVPPRLMLPVSTEFDDLTADTVLGILRERGSLDHEADASYLDLARRRIFRAVFKGGLSIRSTAVAVQAAYTAGTLQALPAAAHIVSLTPAWKALVPLHGTPSKGTIERLVLSAPCLKAALGEEQWGRWKTLAAASGHATDVALSETGQIHGAMSPDPGTGKGIAPSNASILASMTPAQAVRGALAGTLPKKLQHVMTTLEEADRDRRLEESLREQATASLSLSKQAWHSSAPLSPTLAYLHLMACSGPGHEWILDSTRRRHRNGAPPRIALYHSDAPLDGPTAVMALRAHLLLPLGDLYRAAQSDQGIDTHSLAPPRCFCHAPCDENRARFLDYYGLHLMSRVVAAQYTKRHNEYVGALTALLRKAGFTASTEKSPFRVNTDLGDLPEDQDAEGAGTRWAAVDRSMRLDVVVEAMPVDMLRRVDPELVSHLPKSVTTAKVLIDATFTHPGPFLQHVLARDAATVLADADAMGHAEVRGKRDKYLAASIAAGYVLLPYHCNVYGRLHPTASRFLDAVVDMVVTRQLATDPAKVSPLADSTTSFKRALLRGVSIHMQRATIAGLLSAVRVVRPRFRDATVASLPFGATSSAHHHPSPGSTGVLHSLDLPFLSRQSPEPLV